MEVHLYFSEEFIPPNIFLKSDPKAVEEAKVKSKQEGCYYKVFGSQIELQKIVGIDIAQNLTKLLKGVSSDAEPIGLKSKSFLEYVTSSTSALVELTGLTNNAASLFNEFSESLSKRTAEMNRAKKMKHAHVIKPAFISIGKKLATDMTSISGRLDINYRDGRRIGMGLMLEIQLMLELLSSKGKHFFRTTLQENMLEYRNALSTSLENISGLKASVSDFGYLVEEMFPPRVDMIEAIREIENFQVDMILSIDRLILKYGNTSFVSSRNNAADLPG